MRTPHHYCYRRPSPHNPTRRPNNYSNDCARSPSLLGLVMGLSAAVMKIFLMTQDSIDLERPTKAITMMWDAMKMMHEPSVIEGSAEANNQLVEIIIQKLRAKQLPHTSDRPFGNSRGSHNEIGMGNSWVPQTNM
jgi:hypothetical protein